MSKDPMGGFDKPQNKNEDYEDDGVVSNVQKHLKKFGGAEDDSLETPPTPEAKEEQAEEEESTPVKDEQDEQADKSEPSPESSEQKAVGDKKLPIPDNHYRALIHQGWTPEKVSQIYEKDSELLLELAEKAFDDVNNLSRTFSDLGRSRIAIDSKKMQPQRPQQVQQVQQQGPSLEKLREQYENDPFGAMVELVKMVNQPQAQSQTQQAAIAQQPAVSREQFNEDLALTQHLIQFWGDDDMKPYSDFYGPVFNESNRPYLTTDHLTPGQVANRQRVLVEADRILAGASLQGTDMPLQEALAMAHMIVSAPIAKQILRKELTSQVKKKAKGMTLKPTSRKAASSKKGGAKPEAQLEKDTEARLQRYKEGKPLKE